MFLHLSTLPSCCIQRNTPAQGDFSNPYISSKKTSKEACERAYQSTEKQKGSKKWTDEQTKAFVELAEKNINQYGFVNWKNVEEKMQGIKPATIKAYKKKYQRIKSEMSENLTTTRITRKLWTEKQIQALIESRRK